MPDNRKKNKANIDKLISDYKASHPQSHISEKESDALFERITIETDRIVNNPAAEMTKAHSIVEKIKYFLFGVGSRGYLRPALTSGFIIIIALGISYFALFNNGTNVKYEETVVATDDTPQKEDQRIADSKTPEEIIPESKMTKSVISRIKLDFLPISFVSRNFTFDQRKKKETTAELFQKALSLLESILVANSIDLKQETNTVYKTSWYCYETENGKNIKSRLIIEKKFDNKTGLAIYEEKKNVNNIDSSAGNIISENIYKKIIRQFKVEFYK